MANVANSTENLAYAYVVRVVNANPALQGTRWPTTGQIWPIKL